MAMATGRLTIYHDGSCPLCRREIAHYRRRDAEGRLAFVDVSKAEGSLDDGLSAKDAMARFHVRLPDGSLRSGAAAFVAVWRVLPGWRRVARLASLPGMIRVLEFGYRLSLPTRPLLARLVSKLER